MSVSLTVNGTSYTFPTTSDEDWGTNVTNWASSVSSNTLQKNGGNFTLTADVNFGSNYGLLSSYFSSRADAADAGLVRLSNTDYIAFRNSADDGNLILGLSGDTLQFNSVDVADVSSSQSLSNKTIVDLVLNGSVSGTAVLDEDDMSSDSATALATQQSIKAYVDSQISSNNDASEISYDNSTSGLTATDVNAAIDELEDEIDADVANLSSHTANTSNPHSVTASQLGLGNVDNTSDATKNSASATLENKTLDAPVIDNSLVLAEESSSPSAPSSGYKKLYAKNDGKVYTLDSSSNEIEVGSGSGGGEESISRNMIVESERIPIGSINPFAGSSAPSGYLLCDGSLVSRTTYANLFAVLGTSYGEGDGSTTFHLPDLRGRFLRGVDGATGNDPDAATRTASNTGGATGDNVGSLQGDRVGSASASVSTSGTVSIPSTSGTHGGYLEGNKWSLGGRLSRGLNGFASHTTDNFSVSTSGTVSLGSGETRPKNVSVNYIIKF